MGNGHPALWGAPDSCPEEGPALYGSMKTALPSHPLHIPGRSEASLVVSPPWAASHKEQAPEGRSMQSHSHAKKILWAIPGPGRAGTQGRPQGAGTGGATATWACAPTARGNQLPQGNQPHAAEGGRPGGGAHPVSESQPQQEGPACPTSWQAASSGPQPHHMETARPHMGVQEPWRKAHGQLRLKVRHRHPLARVAGQRASVKGG